MQKPPVVVVVTGPPASGKTTLARRLARLTKLPLVTKDDLKEILYDHYGWGDEEREKKASAATYDLIYHAVEVAVRSECSLIVESNFRPESAQYFATLRERFEFEVLQIRCDAAREVLVERFARRIAEGSRHPGHPDERSLDNPEKLFSSGAALQLPGRLIHVDTTNPQAEEITSVCEEVLEILRLQGFKGSRRLA